MTNQTKVPSLGNFADQIKQEIDLYILALEGDTARHFAPGILEKIAMVAARALVGPIHEQAKGATITLSDGRVMDFREWLASITDDQ